MVAATPFRGSAITADSASVVVSSTTDMTSGMMKEFVLSSEQDFLVTGVISPNIESSIAAKADSSETVISRKAVAPGNVTTATSATSATSSPSTG